LLEKYGNQEALDKIILDSIIEDEKAEKQERLERAEDSKQYNQAKQDYVSQELRDYEKLMGKPVSPRSLKTKTLNAEMDFVEKHDFKKTVDTIYGTAKNSWRMIPGSTEFVESVQQKLPLKQVAKNTAKGATTDALLMLFTAGIGKSAYNLHKANKAYKLEKITQRLNKLETKPLKIDKIKQPKLPNGKTKALEEGDKGFRKNVVDSNSFGPNSKITYLDKKGRVQFDNVEFRAVRGLLRPNRRNFR
jgi:hypothetical protein